MDDSCIKNFHDLIVWQKGHALVLFVYSLLKKFPAEERFGIISQMQRAATSITANIAEGFERFYFKDKIHFYYNARGSVAELQNFLFITKDLAFIKYEEFEVAFKQAEEVRKLINGLIKSAENQL